MDEPHRTYSFEDFTIDLVSYRLLRGNAEVLVEGKPFGGIAFDALVFFAQHPNTKITDDELIVAISKVPLTNDAARKWVESIRVALGDRADLIQRVPGKGWRFNTLVVTNIEVGLATTRVVDSDSPRDQIESKAGPLEKEIPTAPRKVSETFEGWISDRGWLILIWMAPCVVAPIAVSLATKGTPDDTMRIVSLIQCGIIFVLVLHAWRWNKPKTFLPINECRPEDILAAGFQNPDEFKVIKSDLETDLESFRRWWIVVLISWIPLYLVFGFADLNTDSGKALQIVFNAGNTLSLLLCFNVLNRHTDQPEEGHLSGKVLNYLLFVVLISVVVVLSVSGHLEGATVLVGISAGITMALFVGRLQSKFLKTRFWIVYLLYSYTAIQPLVLYLDEHPAWGVQILDFALFLKCLLYLLITYLFQSGLLMFYFTKARDTDTLVRDQQRAFLRLMKP